LSIQSDAPVLEMERICKSFPGVRALDEVSFRAYPGQVHVLLGENGAGKSTLMKVLAGVYPKDSGTILFEGRQIEIGSTREALDLGISMVYQEPSLALHLSAAENIFLGREILLSHKLGILDRQALNKNTAEILKRLNLSFSPQAPVRELSAAQRQMVEIAKALSAEARIIILDEPTASLSETEIERLFQVIRDLKKRGIAFIYISHRLEEISEIGDRVTVLRDGRVVDTVPASSPVDQMIRMMVGKPVKELFPRVDAPKGEELLRVENLCSKDILHDISFSVSAGEIVGLGGLVGSRRTELARAVFGADPLDSGRILVQGQPVRINSPADAIKAGIGYLSEDRKLVSLALSMSVRANITLATLDKCCAGPLLLRKKEYRLVENYIRDLGIKTRHADQKVEYLSGGNQQKVVVARWLATDAKVLFFDEPATGVDVGAKTEIYQLINQLAMQGRAVVIISSYLPELLAVCDRILVMCRGRIARELSREEATQEKILYFSAVGS
jgi:ribose transport system ATP-binding protein